MLIIIDKLTVNCTNNCEKAGNEVINIFISEDMENIPFKSRMTFHTNFTNGLFFSKTLAYW